MPHCDEALKLIGGAIAAYQREHGGKNPPTLETLAESGVITLWDLVCPANRYPIGESSYVYRGGDLDEGAPAELILAYDKDPVHKERRNILFADGAVKRLPEKIFDSRLRKDNVVRGQLGLEEKRHGR